MAQQMGYNLQRTAISTAVEERLGFGFAVLSPSGELTGNTLRVPVRLARMRTSVLVCHRYLFHE